MTWSKPIFLVPTTSGTNSNIPEISKLYSIAHFQETLTGIKWKWLSGNSFLNQVNCQPCPKHHTGHTGELDVLLPNSMSTRKQMRNTGVRRMPRRGWRTKSKGSHLTKNLQVKPELPKPGDRMKWVRAKVIPKWGKVYVEAQRETKHNMEDMEVHRSRGVWVRLPQFKSQLQDLRQVTTHL